MRLGTVLSILSMSAVLASGVLFLSGCGKCDDQACPVGEKVGEAASKAKESAEAFGAAVKKGYQETEQKRNQGNQN